MGNYDVETIRKRMREKKGQFKDPHQFIPPKAKSGETLKYRFIILPPLQKGDPVDGGTASRDMDVFYVANGSHWHNNRPYPCPRIHDGEECELCSNAWELMKDVTDQDERRAIAQNWLPRTGSAVNIYFLRMAPNPEELWGKVMWFNAPKTIQDMFEACLMRDDAGKVKDEPEAFGCFYDEESAYVFQLEITNNGQYNDYKKSKFWTNASATKGKRPLACKVVDGKATNTPDPEKIKGILDKRYDLYTKFPARSSADIAKIAAQMMGGSAEKEGDGFEEEGGTSTDGVAGEVPVKLAAKPAAKPAVKPAAKPATKLVAKPAAKPAPKSAAKPVAEEVEPEAEAEVDGEGEVVAGEAEPEAKSDDVPDEELESLLGEINEPAE